MPDDSNARGGGAWALRRSLLRLRRNDPGRPSEIHAVLYLTSGGTPKKAQRYMHCRVCARRGRKVMKGPT